MIPVELISMAAGGIAGFVFKFIAERAKERAELFKMAVQTHEMEESAHNAAVERVPLEAGKWVRRLIVVSILFGVILAPFILALLDQPLYVQIEQEKIKWLFGLFGGGKEVFFVRIDGFLMIPEVRQILTSIVGFYFGTSAAK
jgi:hypothetical protein